MNEIHLMLVDDHEVVRTGLKTYLETQPGLKVIICSKCWQQVHMVMSPSKPQRKN